MLCGVTTASTPYTSTSPILTESSRISQPWATPLAVFICTGWPLVYCSPMRSASGLPMATVEAPVSTMYCMRVPLIMPVLMKWPRASAINTTRRPPVRLPTLTGASPSRKERRAPSTSTRACSFSTEITRTPWWVSPTAIPRGALPLTTNSALLPRMPASATAVCA